MSDERIRAVVALNPVTSAIFGPESMAQIDVPLLMLTSSADTIAPALTEQIRPFSWLTNRDRYLLLIDGGTHFSTIGTSGDESFLFPPELVGTFSATGRRYTQVMSLAFLSTYLKGDTPQKGDCQRRFRPQSARSSSWQSSWPNRWPNR